jgi:predicted Ser/Thr protein kinase
METKQICSICGKPLTAGAPEGLCPECLLKAGLGTGVDIGADTGGKAPRFVPPKIEELAPKFPQLEILEFIGQGGMGAVYKGRQKQLDRIVALKILPPQAAIGAGFAERFTREARALARLNHPHIVTLYEFGQADGLFYFLMEFVDGVNLRQLLNSSRISPREALAIVPQICEALQFAHDTGIVHRDIKPENILLDKKGQVKIADFGVAKLVTQGMEESAAEKTAPSGDLTEAGSSLGTPQYMAPEQIKNSAEVDHRADIYSLGVVFYQMLTGELPSGKIEPPSKKVVIDVRLDEVVLRALEKEPELRYQQISDVKTIIETIATTPQPSPQTISQKAGPQAQISDRKLAFIKIPFVTLRHGKPVTSWPIVLAAGVFLEFLVLWYLLLRAAIGMPDVLPAQVIVVIVLPIMALIPLWLYYEIRAGHNALTQGQPPLPLLSRRKKLVHRIVGGLLAVLLIAFYLRTFAITPYRVETDSVAPEIPRGSHFLVWRLAHTFSPGDLIAYRNGNDVFISRVIRVENDHLLVNKNNRPNTIVLRNLVIGKVISIYWRGATPVKAPVETPAKLAFLPEELKTLPSDEVFQAGLAQPQMPWPWMELKNRAGTGALDDAEAQKLTTELTAWMHDNYPNGYDTPLNDIGDFLEEMHAHRHLPETNMMAFLVAYAGNPRCEPLPRVREGDPTLSLSCNFRSPWNYELFGLSMLNEIHSVRIDNQPVSFRAMFQSWNLQQNTLELQLPALAPGSHTVQCDIVSAYANESDLTGLDTSTRSMDWPPAKLHWTRSCQATFMVYPAESTIVTLSDDPALNPVSNNAVSIKRIIIRRENGQSKATADFNVNPTPSLPVSVDVTLRIGGQSIKCGTLKAWAWNDNGSRASTTGNNVLETDLDSLAPQIQEADVVLDPDLQAIESAPTVDRIWGHETVISHVPLKRDDLLENEQNILN